MKRLILTLAAVLAAQASLSAQNWYQARFQKAGSASVAIVSLEAANEASFTAKAKDYIGQIMSAEADELSVVAGTLVRSVDHNLTSYTAYVTTGDVFHDCYAYNFRIGQLVQFVMRCVTEGQAGTTESISWRAREYALQEIWPADTADEVYFWPTVRRTTPPPGFAAAPAPARDPLDAPEPSAPAATTAVGDWYRVQAWRVQSPAEKYDLTLEASTLNELDAKARVLLHRLLSCRSADVRVQLDERVQVPVPYRSASETPADGAYWFDCYLLNSQEREGAQVVMRSREQFPRLAEDMEYRSMVYVMENVWTGRPAVPNYGIQSIAVVARPFGVPDRLPAPAGFRAVPAQGAASLSWSPVPGADGYVVEYNRQGSGTYFTPIATNSLWLRVECTPNQAWTFSVAAKRGIETGPATERVTVTPLPMPVPPTPLSAPTNVRLTPGPGTLTAAWNAAGGATSYVVDVTSDGNTTSFPTTALSCVCGSLGAREYQVTVQSVKGNERKAAAAVTGRPLPACGRPAAPRVTAGPGKLNISWDAVPGATKYSVELRHPDGNRALEYNFDLPDGVLSYSWPRLTAGKSYEVAIQAQAGRYYYSGWGPRTAGTPDAVSAPIILGQSGGNTNKPGAATVQLQKPVLGSWEVQVRIVYKSGTQEDRTFTVPAATEAGAKEAGVAAAVKYAAGKGTKSVTALKATKKK